MPLRERILQYIREHPEGSTDSQIRRDLGIVYHQQVNSRCHGLQAIGLIERRLVGDRIHNFPVDGAEAVPPRTPSQVVAADDYWFWEGNVQDSVVEYLKAQGYTILRCANCRTRERGKDIEAQNGDGPLWVTVKGYPKGTAKTRASTQAGHWFKQGLFDVVAWRGDNNDAQVAFALPDFPRYRKLSEKVAWLVSAARFSFIWVQQDGSCGTK